jgi:hypothetical protein
LLLKLSIETVIALTCIRFKNDAGSVSHSYIAKIKLYRWNLPESTTDNYQSLPVRACQNFTLTLVFPKRFPKVNPRIGTKKKTICREPRSLSENADEELAFPLSFHGITPNRPTTTLKHTIQTICYGIMATNNII